VRFRAPLQRWNIKRGDTSYYELEAASKGRWTLRNVDYLYTAKTDIITVYEDKAVVAINWIDTALEYFRSQYPALSEDTLEGARRCWKIC
jgi:hypothetical protein